MKSLKFAFALLILTLSISFQITANAQNDPPKRRLKIGLALTGGSALGLSHIGVLDWFEKKHIPIDYLAGTSMGGLVGGGYASGLNVDEIRKIFKNIDWEDVLRGEIAFKEQSFRRKEDFRQVPTKLSFGLRGGLKLPSGINPANPINLLLSRISLPYSDLKNFDDLPIPFRCMATDMKRGEAVALKDGSLATALRSTMALPGVFTPVERDGTLYTDGGTLNNTPTEAVKAMGADIIVAVDLSAGFLTNKNIEGSFFSILARTINVATYANERQSLKLADVILSPELGKLSITDFVKVEDFEKKGFDAADAKSKILLNFALPDAEWAEYLAQKNSKTRRVNPEMHAVLTEGVTGRKATALARRIAPLLEFSLDTAKLDRLLSDISGEGRYESFIYEATALNGTKALLIRAQERKHGPPFVHFGLSVNGAESNSIRTDFFGRFTSLDVGKPGAEIRADLKLGSDKEVFGEYYFPFARGDHWFIAPYGIYRDNNLNFYRQGLRQAVYGDVTTGIGSDIGVRTSRESELRLGYQYAYERSTIRTGSPVLPSLNGAVSVTSLKWTYDGQDSPIIPSRGARVTAIGNYYFNAPGAVKAFPTLDVQLLQFYPKARGDSTFLIAGIGTSLGNQVAPLQQFTSGGPFRLGAYNQDALRGNDYLRLSVGYLKRIATLPSFIGGKVMLGAWYELGGAFERFDHARYLSDVTVSFLAETALGPVIFGYSYGEHGSNKLYFTIGRLF